MALIDDLVAWATEGLDASQAEVVKKALERDNVKAKASTLKQQHEYQALVDAQRELEGDKANKVLGARDYQVWYTQNAPAIEKLNKDVEAYRAKYGSLENPTPTPTPTPASKTYTDDDIKRIVDSRIQDGYTPTWSNVVKGSMSVMQKHILAKRTTPIDIDKLSETAAQKFNGNLDLAYEDWVKPEVEKEQKAATEAEIKRRVDEELQKRGTQQHFPGGMDQTPGALAGRSKDELEKFDKTAFRRDLANTFMSN